MWGFPSLANQLRLAANETRVLHTLRDGTKVEVRFRAWEEDDTATEDDTLIAARVIRPVTEAADVAKVKAALANIGVPESDLGVVATFWRRNHDHVVIVRSG